MKRRWRWRWSGGVWLNTTTAAAAADEASLLIQSIDLSINRFIDRRKGLKAPQRGQPMKRVRTAIWRQIMDTHDWLIDVALIYLAVVTLQGHVTRVCPSVRVRMRLFRWRCRVFVTFQKTKSDNATLRAIIFWARIWYHLWFITCIRYFSNWLTFLSSTISLSYAPCYRQRQTTTDASDRY